MNKGKVYVNEEGHFLALDRVSSFTPGVRYLMRWTSVLQEAFIAVTPQDEKAVFEMVHPEDVMVLAATEEMIRTVTLITGE